MRLPLADYRVAGLDDERHVVRSEALMVIFHEVDPPPGALGRVMARIDADGWQEAFDFSHHLKKCCGP